MYVISMYYVNIKDNLISSINNYYYYDGKLLDALKSWSKYYQMGLFIVGGIGLYLLIKNNPQNGKELFSNASEVVKCLPIDKNSKDLLTPLFDFSTRNFNGGGGYTSQARRMFNSGRNGTKRSVRKNKEIFMKWEIGITQEI